MTFTPGKARVSITFKADSEREAMHPAYAKLLAKELGLE